MIGNLIIIYRDTLGRVTEKIDRDGINFLNGTGYFNDKKIPIDAIEFIGIEETE